jgi:transposase InsO family protein
LDNLFTQQNSVQSGTSPDVWFDAVSELPVDKADNVVECRYATFSPAGHIKIPVKINGVETYAVLDTGAQCSLLNSKFAKLHLSNLNNAGTVFVRGISSEPVSATFVNNLSVGIKNRVFAFSAAITDMSDDCLLGLDFILSNGLDISGSKKTIVIGDISLPIDMSVVPLPFEVSPDVHVRCVSLKKCIKIPPYTAMTCPVQLSVQIPTNAEFVIFVPNDALPISLPSVLFPNGNVLPLVLYNDTDKFVTLSNDLSLGVVTNSDEYVEKPLSKTEMPDLEIRKLTVANFSDSFPATESEHFTSLCDSLPSHLTDLFKRSSQNITLHHSVDLLNLLVEFQSIFSTGDTDIGHYQGVYHYINTHDECPIKQRMRRTPFHFESEEEGHLKKMLDSGVISESSSEYAHPVCLIRKRDGGIRYCIDLRKLNEKTIKDTFPLPKIEQCLDTLSGSQYFSTLDLASGYWQIEIAPEHRHKTAFLTKFGLFQHEKMAFGLCNAPATFQRAMQQVLSGLLWTKALVYIDDVIVLGDSFGTSIENLREIFNRFLENNLKLKPKKCTLFQKKVEYLGRLVSPEGTTLKSGHVELMRKWPIPSSKKELESFLGFANYHRNYMKNYSKLSDPLYKYLSSVSNGPMVLPGNLVDIVNVIKEQIIDAPVLPYPDPESTFILDCDASHTAIGCELSQVVNGEERVVSFASFSLNPAQRRYCTTRKELLAVVRFTEHFKHYLLGRPFICRTDHNSLTWLMGFKNIEGPLARWLEYLAQYDMVLVHRPGKKHINADVLSRIPDPDVPCSNYRSNVRLEDLPCFQDGKVCNYCQKMSDQWERFDNDIDYVVPLTVRLTSASSSNENSNKNSTSDQNSISDLWFPSYTATDLRKHQESDADLKTIINWLESERIPTQAQLALSGPGVRHYWQLRSQLFFSDKVLYYKWEDPLEPKNLFVVPSILQDEVLKLNHDIRDAGHLGQHNTYSRVKNSFYWFRMRSDINLYVRTCAKCNTNKKPSRKKRAGLGEFHAGAPMDRVHIDVLGPFTKSPKGNTVILLVIDQFTKWLECFPLPDQSAELVAKTVLDEFFARFGCPLEIHTDQGKNFMSNLFSSLCNLLQITKKRTTSYHPQSNGQVERMNRTLLQMLRCLRDKNIKNWDLYVPQLCGAIRSTLNRSTGFTPNKLMLGREVFKPCNLVFGVPNDDRLPRSPEVYVRDMEDILRQVHAVARENLQQSVSVNKRDYDLRIRQAQYDVGDFVYVLNNHPTPGISRKLQPIYKGPFLVVKVLSEVLYRLRDRRREFVTHHDRLLLCQDRFVPLWLRRLRQQVMDLDETIAYDEQELRDDVNEYGETDIVPDLSRLFAGLNGPSNSMETNDLSLSSPEDSVPLDQINDDLVEPVDALLLTQSVTRRGRCVKIPKKFDDYVLGDSDE